jgi:peptidoglycan pentaglycine glycine transferase (the first glycine)
MSIQIREIKEKNVWQNYNDKIKPPTFLHTWNWGEFQEKTGNKIWRLGIFEKEKLEGIALIIKIKAKRGTFLFCPHGPQINWENLEHVKALVDHLKILAKKEKACFIRLSPTLLESEKSTKLFEDLKFRKAPMHIHSELTWILDVTKDEEELLKDMRKVNRYSIRKSEKEGVKVQISSNPDDFEEFYKVYNETVSHQKFQPFTKAYFQKEFDCFSKDDKVLWFFAEYNNEIIGTAMIIFSNGSAFYHHGASIMKYKKIPAAHLLQWETIREAKRRGCKYYNFWGIAPENKPKHPWQGFTFFKTGFGGKAYDFTRSRDLVLGPRYWVNFLVETVRRVRRGY